MGSPRPYELGTSNLALTITDDSSPSGHHGRAKAGTKGVLDTTTGAQPGGTLTYSIVGVRYSPICRGGTALTR